MTDDEFKRFLSHLRAFLGLYQVQLTPKAYDALEVWPLNKGEDELHFPGIENHTMATRESK
jgi:hypothetical protein